MIQLALYLEKTQLPGKKDNNDWPALPTSVECTSTVYYSTVG
jgi:hypothetical protein